MNKKIIAVIVLVIAVLVLVNILHQEKTENLHLTDLNKNL